MMIQEPTPAQQLIIDTVLDYYQLDSADFYQHLLSRKREYLYPRQFCMLFISMFTKTSDSDIGRILGKNHATVISGKKEINNLLDTNDYDVSTAYAKIADKLDLIDFKHISAVKKPLPEDTIYSVLGFYPNPDNEVSGVTWNTILGIINLHVSNLKKISA